MSRVDSMVHQQAGPINLERAKVLATFEQNFNIVTCARENVREKPISEMISAQVPVAEDLTGWDLDLDVHWQDPAELDDDLTDLDIQDPAELDDHTHFINDWNYDQLYNSDDDQCGCHSAFGKDDDGKVLHYGLDCEYGS